MIAIAALIILTDAAIHSDDGDPLAKAEQGYLQCYEPNEVTKTCRSLASYKRNADGTWDNTAIVLLAPNQPITLETVTPVSIKDGAVCGFIRREDVLKGKLRFSGQLVPDDKAASALASIAESMTPLMNKEICTSYVASQTDLTAKAKIAGETMSVPDQRVKWVPTLGGYSVAPNPTGTTK